MYSKSKSPRRVAELKRQQSCGVTMQQDDTSAISHLQHLCHILQTSVKPYWCQSLSTSHASIIDVTPRVSLFDEKVHIRVQGLPSSAKVTLHLATEQEWRRTPALFVSCSHHVTSLKGEVDLNESPSLGGTYTGKDPMGLFWSLVPDPSGPQNIRMVVRNVEQPCLYTLSIYLGHLTLKQLHTGTEKHQPLSSTVITRLKMAANVRRIPVKAGNIRGTLFLPPGDGPHQGVIDMYGSSGGIMEMRAALLASHGFATLALPYFRYQDLPARSLDAVQFEYFEEALNWFTSQAYIRDGGIGIVAISTGALFGMLMAWQFPQVRALVQLNGPNMMWVNDLYYKGKLFVKRVPMNIDLLEQTSDGVVVTEAFPHTSDDIIPVWEGSAKVLILVSEDDKQCNPQYTDELISLCPESKRNQIEVVRYHGAGHLLEPPYTPHCRGCLNPGFDMEMIWGGEPAQQAAAQDDAWERILTFLRKHLP